MESYDLQNIYSVCRLCLVEDASLSIFDMQFTALPQRIAACVNVEVQQNDKISTLICRQCIKKIEEWYLFKKTSEENQIKLRIWVETYYYKSTDIVNVSIKEEINDADEQMQNNELSIVYVKNEPLDTLDYFQQNELVEVSHVSPQYAVPIFSADEDSKESLLVPERECPVSFHGRDPPAVRCRICSKMFSSKQHCLKHEIAIHHFKTDFDHSSNESSKDSTLEINYPFAYSELSSDVTQYKNIQHKNLTITESEYISYYKTIYNMLKNRTCNCCNFQFSTAKTLLAHLRKQMKVVLYSCYQCCISFPNISQYRTHIGRMECRQRARLLEDVNCSYKAYQCYKCNFCSFICASEASLRDHIESKHKLTDLPTVCPKCDTFFNDFEKFEEHLFGPCIYRIFCSICKTDYASLEEFNIHTSIHDDKKTLDFLDTSSKLNTISNFKSSKLTESVINPASVATLEQNPDGKCECNLCHKILSNYQNLLKHLKLMHDETDVHICKFCPSSSLKKYILKCQMTEHMLLYHRNINSQNCDEELTNHLFCNYCGASFTQLDDWKEHQKSHSTNNVCLQCDQTFNSVVELEEHARIHSNLKLKLYRCSKSNSYKSKTLVSSFPYSVTCNICNKYFGSKKELKKHVAFHKKMPLLKGLQNVEGVKEISNNFQCPLCEKSYKFPQGLYKHKKVIHGLKTVLPELRLPKPANSSRSKIITKQQFCAHCNIMFASYKAAWRHRKKHHQLSLTKKRKVLVQHISTNSKFNDFKSMKLNKKREYTCKICSISFFSGISLSNHLRTHINKKGNNAKKIKSINYQCLKCKTVCSSARELVEHLQSHLEKNDLKNGEDPNKLYPCMYCDKICSTLGAAINHMKIHRAITSKTEHNLKPVKYKCNICSKTFSTGEHLALHIKSHRKKRGPGFKCKVCYKKYENIHALSGHMSAHKAKIEIKMEPTNADNENGTLSNLDIISQIADNNQIQCVKCDKNFDTSQSYRAHKGWHQRVRRGSLHNKSDNIFENTNEIDSNISVQKSDEDDYHCDECDQHFTSVGSFKVHKSWHTRGKMNSLCYTVNNIENIKAANFDSATVDAGGNKQYYCKECDQQFSLEDSYKGHVTWHTRSKRNSAYKSENDICESINISPDSNNDPEQLYCSECNQHFSSADSYKSHIVLHTHVQKTSTCTSKSEMVDNPNVILSLTVNDSKHFYCNECNQQFTSVFSYRGHKGWHSRTKRNSTHNLGNTEHLHQGECSYTDGITLDSQNFLCVECNESFNNFKTYKIHEDGHKKDKKGSVHSFASQPVFKCHSCKFKTENKRDFETHRSTHRIKMYTCTYCEKQYSFLASFKKHLQTLHDDDYVEKGNDNDESENTEKRISRRIEAKRTSLSERVYKCTECNTGFPNAKKLRLHVATHSDNTT